MLGRDKGWWQEKAFLLLFLLVGAFLIIPNDTVKGAYCGFGFTSFCTPTLAPDALMKPGQVIEKGGWRIERIN